MEIPSRRFVPPNFRVRQQAAWIWERQGWEFRRILIGGGWSIHDVIDRPQVRAAVEEQWRIHRTIEKEREVDSYIGYLEYLEYLSVTR